MTDAGYGNNSELRADITALELSYVAGILSNTTVWAPGTGPLPPKTWSGRGRPPKLLRRDTRHRPVRSRNWRSACPSAPAAPSNGEKARPSACPRALPVCGFALRDVTSSAEPTGRVAVDRVARRREGADQVLALNPSRGHHSASTGLLRQAALAHRARLSRTQAGGRARAISPRPRMARLPSPRNAVHRSLRIPDLREGATSPLRNSFHRAAPAICPIQGLPTQKAPPPRPERHVPNSIATMRRRLITALVRTLPRCPCCAAPIRRPRR